MDAPLIVAAVFGAADQAQLDVLRRTHFPPERNHLPAHLTLFHHLPPSIEGDLIGRLVAATRDEPPPPARLTAVRSLGRGLALTVDSPMLMGLREGLADAFAGLLTPQDQAQWWPHVTIQNKVSLAAARTLMDQLSATFHPTPLRVVGLGLWRYRGGPWELVRRFPFQGDRFR